MRSGSDRQGRGGDWRHVERACRIAFGAGPQVSCVLLDLHPGVASETLQRARHPLARHPDLPLRTRAWSSTPTRSTRPDTSEPIVTTFDSMQAFPVATYSPLGIQPLDLKQFPLVVRR